MTSAQSSLPLALLPGPGLGRRLVGWTFSLAVTAGIFWGISRFDHQSPASPPADIMELKAVVLDEPLPPPPRVVPEQPLLVEAALRGIEAVHSESPVQLALLPPDVEHLLPPAPEAPPAVIQPGQLHTDLKPRIELAPPGDHIYQMAEVDQLPRVLHRVTPEIPRHVRGDATQLRVTLLFVVDATGEVKNARLAMPSGNPGFDTIILETIRQWSFSPAVRRGVRVRCLIQQSITIRWSGGSPFQL